MPYIEDMSTTEIHNQVRKHLATKTDADPVEMMMISDDRAVTMHIADELCARRPEIVAALDEWKKDLEGTESLADVVIRVAG